MTVTHNPQVAQRADRRFVMAPVLALPIPELAILVAFTTATAATAMAASLVAVGRVRPAAVLREL